MPAQATASTGIDFDRTAATTTKMFVKRTTVNALPLGREDLKSENNGDQPTRKHEPKKLSVSRIDIAYRPARRTHDQSASQPGKPKLR